MQPIAVPVWRFKLLERKVWLLARLGLNKKLELLTYPATSSNPIPLTQAFIRHFQLDQRIMPVTLSLQSTW